MKAARPILHLHLRDRCCRKMQVNASDHIRDVAWIVLHNDLHNHIQRGVKFRIQDLLKR